MTLGVLRTKLYPPRLPPILERESLLGELEQARYAKLTAMVAGAGYGKTTLAAEFLQDQDCPYVWYQLGEADCDLSVFLSYLIAGIEGVYPGFGAKTMEHIAAAENVSRQSRPILSSLISELDELIGEELFIALDDFQAVNESPQVVEAMDFLLGHLMPGLHFMVLSRSVPRLDLTHLRARREMLELVERDLCFTAGEASVLFRDVFGMSLPETDVAALAESTEGWVSGLVLFYLAQKGKDPERVRDAVRASALYPSSVFEYFSKAAYDNQPEEVRAFTARTSVLSRMNPAFCDQLLDVDNSREMFDRLLEGRLFTIPLDDVGEWYRYHHGLQAFLQNTLQECFTPQNITGLHLKAASLWEKYGDPEQALGHYLQAEAFDQAADLLEDISERWIVAGRVNFLDRELLRLPAEILNTRPKLLHATAVTAELTGDFGHSLAAALAAGEAFALKGKQEEKAKSLILLASAMSQMGQLAEARKAIAAAYAAMPPGSPRIYGLMAVDGYMRLFKGDTSEAILLSEEVLGHIAEIEDASLKIPIIALCGSNLFFDGKIGRAVEVFVEGLKAIEAVDLRSHAVSFYTYLTTAFALMERLREANELAEKSVVLARELDLPTMTMLSHATRAFARARTGGHDGTMEDALITASMYERSGIVALMAVAAWLLVEAYAAVKEDVACIEQLSLLKDLLGEYEEFKHFAAMVEIACTFEKLGPRRVIERVREVSKELGPRGIGLARSYAYALRFRAEVAAGDHQEAVAVLSDYIEEFGQDIILRLGSCTDIEPILAPFTDLFAEGKCLDLMERVYRLGGRNSLPYLHALLTTGDAEGKDQATVLIDAISRETAPPLSIRLLGHFELSRGGQALLPQEWKSQKALTVLKYLALNRDSGLIAREVLMELLWPGFTPENAARSLNTALTFIRRTLDPEAARGQSSYVVSSGGSLSLDLGAGGWTDVELFVKKLARACEEREEGDFDSCFFTLLEAEELYGGDLLCDEPYEDWCVRERESLRSDYLRLLDDLATEYLRRGEDQDALKHLEKTLNKDPGREEVYRRMMVIYSRMGNRSGIEETFRRCDRYLRKNYEVQPSAVTVELYEKLRRS